MTSEDYRDTWVSLVNRRQSLANERSDLEIRLSELKTEIAHLDGIIEHLTPLAGEEIEPGSIVGLGITEAIRTVLRQPPVGRMAAGEVFRALDAKNFDFSSYTNPMASIYKILARLAENDEVEVEKDGRNVFYTWKLRDEDIPF